MSTIRDSSSNSEKREGEMWEWSWWSWSFGEAVVAGDSGICWGRMGFAKATGAVREIARMKRGGRMVALYYTVSYRMMKS